MTIVAILASFAGAFVVCRALCRGSFGRLDTPNERSLHDQPRPRTGGLAILAGAALGVLGLILTQNVERLWIGIGIGAVALALVSWIDDFSNLSPAIRFPVHLGSAAIAVGFGAGVLLADLGLDMTLPIAGGVISVLAITWSTNLYNFMDGMDGFAGGMAVIGFSTYGVLAFRSGDAFLGGVSAVIAAAALGFLWFNFPPARIFMGDAGSSTLGFLMATLGIAGVRLGAWPLAVPVIVFSPFAVDATVTLCRRVLAGHKPWDAHRSHYYQRLALSGWGHRRTVLREYILMLAAAMIAITAILPWSVALLATGVGYFALAVAVERMLRRGSRQPETTRTTS